MNAGSWIRQARALVFDFDGTLVDSNPIKAEAFRVCFAAFPDHLQEIRAYCSGNPHIPRRQKFRHVHRSILNRSPSASQEEAFLKRFDEVTTQRIIEAPEIAGAAEFLRRVRSQAFTALLSATPHPVLLRILIGRGWRRFFNRVQGAPVKKCLWLKRLRRELRFKPTEMIFFGDSREDAQAAEDAGCRFIGVGRSDSWDRRFPVIHRWNSRLIPA